MRPKSVILFERLFLFSLLVSALAFILGYDAILASIERQQALQQLGMATTIMVGSFLIGMAIYLLLWFLIARMGIGFAKWVLVLLVAFSLINVPTMVMPPYGLVKLLNLSVLLLEVAAIAMLFRPDAILWLRGAAEDEQEGVD